MGAQARIAEGPSREMDGILSAARSFQARTREGTALELNEETQHELRALGYLGDEE